MSLLRLGSERTVLSPRKELLLRPETTGKVKYPVDLPVPTVLQQEVYVPQDPGSPEEEESKEKKPASQGKSGGKKEPSKRDGKEKRDRSGPRVRGLAICPLFRETYRWKQRRLCRGCSGWRVELLREQAGSFSLLQAQKLGVKQGLSSNPSSSVQFRFLPSLFSVDSVHSAVVSLQRR